MRPHAAFIWMSLCGALTSILKVWAVWERESRHWDTTQQRVTDAQQSANIDPTQCVWEDCCLSPFQLWGGFWNCRGERKTLSKIYPSEQWQLTTELRLQIQGMSERVVGWWSLSRPHIRFLMPDTQPHLILHPDSLSLSPTCFKIT